MPLAGTAGRIIVKLNSLVDQETHRETLRSLLRRRENRPHRPRHLLPAARDSRAEREHSRDQYRRSFPRTQPDLLFCQRRQPGSLSGERRLDAAELLSAGWKSPSRSKIPTLRDEIINEVLPRFLNDHVKARELQSDGTYVRLKPEEGAPRSQAQLHFRERSRRPGAQTRRSADSSDDQTRRPDHHRPERKRMKKILVIDIGGTDRQADDLAQEEAQVRFRAEAYARGSWSREIKDAAEDWAYDAISIGFPAPVHNGRIMKDPKHLGKGLGRMGFHRSR